MGGERDSVRDSFLLKLSTISSNFSMSLDLFFIANGLSIFAVSYVLLKINFVGVVSLALIAYICSIVYDITCDLSPETKEKYYKQFQRFKREVLSKPSKSKFSHTVGRLLEKYVTERAKDEQVDVVISKVLLEVKDKLKKDNVVEEKTTMTNLARLEMELVKVIWEQAELKLILERERIMYKNKIKNLEEYNRYLLGELDSERTVKQACVSKRDELIELVANLEEQRLTLMEENDELKANYMMHMTRNCTCRDKLVQRQQRGRFLVPEFSNNTANDNDNDGFEYVEVDHFS